MSSRRIGRGLRRMLFAFLVLGLTLALWSALAGPAQAAGRPRVPCGAEVRWSVGSSLVAPAGLESAVAWAYDEVASTTRWNVQAVASSPTVSFEWIDRGIGDTSAPGDSVEEALLSGDKVVMHRHLPASTDERKSALRQVVLRDLLRDAGVASPSSTGTGLSKGDRAALASNCATQVEKPGATAPDNDASPARGTATATTSPHTPELPPTKNVPLVPVLLGVSLLAAASAAVNLGARARFSQWRDHRRMPPVQEGEA